MMRHALPFVVLVLHGCMFADVRKQDEIIAAHCAIEGDVSAEGSVLAPLIVVLLRQSGSDLQQRESWQVVDHFVLEEAGRWRFRVAQGTYGLVAFQDINVDFGHQADEPYLNLEPERTLTCRTGEPHSNFALVVPVAGRPRHEEPLDLSGLQTRGVEKQLQVTLGALTSYGEIVSLSDARFADLVIEDGLWRPFDFLFKGGPGIYFLEPYDQNKVPVLFVHGISGSPADFRPLIERLDRKSFQPWLYYYPTGAALDAVADHLTQTFRVLQVKHAFDNFVVLAHSMGGLVARGFILRYEESGGDAQIPLFITMSTPWGGHRAAELGVKTAPAVVKVWIDMAPDSRYQRALFYEDPDKKTSLRKLPDETQHQLLFTFKQDSLNVGEAGDGSVTVASQLRWEAQREAKRLYGFNETHTGVLKSEEAATLINDLLLQAFSPAPPPRP